MVRATGATLALLFLACINAVGDPPDLLNLYYFPSDRVCTQEQLLYNFTHSVQVAVAYARELNGENATPFAAYLTDFEVPGCTLQEAYRAIALLDLLHALQVCADGISAIHIGLRVRS